MNQRAEQKAHRFLRLLNKGMVMVHMDATGEGVIVPPKFQENRELRLNFSYNFPGVDVHVDDEIASATLTFNSIPFHCTVPWTAVYGLSSHVNKDQYWWLEDMPPETKKHLEELASKVAKAVKKEETKRSFGLVEGGRKEDEEPPKAEEAQKPPKKSHLRVVK